MDFAKLLSEKADLILGAPSVGGRLSLHISGIMLWGMGLEAQGDIRLALPGVGTSWGQASRRGARSRLDPDKESPGPAPPAALPLEVPGTRG